MSFLFRKRRSMGAEQGRLGGVPTHAGIQSMDESLQKKFAKGIQFNIKILLRGDRNTGKTCLFHRMQGKQFTEAYIPTDEIQVASILWSYRVTNDTVKVEIWDIVDKGRAQKKTGKSFLKMFNEPSTEADPTDMPLDAEFMDVYKGAHGVVLMFDMTKQWTWKYVERELPKVPLHIPVIILGNFRDLGEHRTVSRDEAVMYINSLDRPEGAAPVRYAESSMKSGFGLMHLHKFLSVPFLQLQQETLLQQLQVNREQSLAAKEELDCAEKSEDQDYNMFLEKIQRLADEKKKKPAPPPLAPDQTSSAGSDSPRLPPRGEAVENVQEDPTSPSGGESQRSGSLSSRLFSGLLSRNKETPRKETADSPKVRKQAKSAMTIDDFVPEGEEVDSFLEDSDEEGEEEDSEDDSDDDIDGGNPQVAMDEDLSSPEEEAPPIKTTPLMPEVRKQPKPLKSANEIVLTESEEESDEPAVMEDEDVSLEELTITPKKEPVSEKKVFSNVPLEELFELPQKKASKAKKKTKKAAEAVADDKPVDTVVKPPKKSGGLMLEFSSVTPPKSKPRATPPTPESPMLKSERRDSKRKKSKKKKETEPVKSEGGAKETSSDPFGAIGSLDAWLNSNNTSKDGSLESSWSTHKSSTVEVGKEADSADDDDDEHREVEKKPKKHRHRRHREEGEERTRKKKHKHKSSSRHRTEEDRSYDVL